MVGFSGPAYLDQTETTFEAIGQKTELTTVTKLPRRIFTFSPMQVRMAVKQCGIEEVFLNFCNYLPDGYQKIVDEINSLPNCRVRWLGFGPSVNDVVELY